MRKKNFKTSNKEFPVENVESITKRIFEIAGRTVRVNKEALEKIIEITKKLAIELNVIGLINLQFDYKNEEIYVLEVNPRASRTVPFVSKTTNVPLARIASQLTVGSKLKDFNLTQWDSLNHVAVKEAVFPFNKFPDSDLLLGPEMKSTGEVMGFDENFGMAFAKSQIGAANSLPKQGLAFVSLKDSHKDEGIELAKELKISPSTVSRILRSKYIQTPKGAVSMKSLLASSVSKTRRVTPAQLMEEIQRIVEDEKKILSDQKISDLLNKRGFNLARRTISKYRKICERKGSKNANIS